MVMRLLALGLGPGELIVILLVVLLIFGPKNLPKIGKALGSTVKNVREGMEEGDGLAAAKKLDDAEDAVVVEETSYNADAQAATKTATATSTADTVSATSTTEPQKGTTAFCPECGAQNNTESKFCTSCGNQLHA